MKTMWLIPLLLLASCGAPADRLTDEQAAAKQNAVIEAPVKIEIPKGASPAPDAGPDIPAPGDVGLADSRWTAIAINERPTPGGSTYYVSFSATGLSAGFGCNSITGEYSVNGDHLAVTNLIQTQMGCAEPAQSFERNGMALLASKMRIERDGEATIRLVSEAGSMDLSRAD